MAKEIDEIDINSDEENVNEEKSNNKTTGSKDASKHSIEEIRERALQRELETLQNVNKVVEDVTASLQKAKSNMSVRKERLYKSYLIIY